MTIKLAVLGIRTKVLKLTKNAMIWI